MNQPCNSCSDEQLLNHHLAEIGNNDTAPQTEQVSLSPDPELQWDGEAKQLESIRRDFAPVEAKTKTLWDIEPIPP